MGMFTTNKPFRLPRQEYSNQSDHLKSPALNDVSCSFLSLLFLHGHTNGKLVTLIRISNNCVRNCNCSFVIIRLNVLVPIYFQCVRNEFDTYEAEALKLVDTDVYYSQRKKTISKRLDHAPENESMLSARETFKFMSHNVICDALITQLEKRKEAYKRIHTRFGFLYNINLSLPIREIEKITEDFQTIYSNDIDNNFTDEFVHFQAMFKDCNSPNECLKKIRTLNISHTFPNVEIAYRLFLTMPITNCSSERSFSVLKRIKNRLRSSLSQNSLQAFSLLTIENDITTRLDFNDIINDFASIKARKKTF